MTASRWFLQATAALAVALGGCASQPAEPPVPAVDFTGFFSVFKTCRERYREIDAKIDAAGVRNPAFYRVPGFPYLRTDRMLASYRNEVQGVNQVGDWLRHMREFDQEAREFEYENLGLSIQEAALMRDELQGCGRGLAGLELDDPAVFKRLVASVVPPDDGPTVPAPHSFFSHLFAPLLRAKVHSHEDALRERFRAPLDGAASGAPATLWQVHAEKDPNLIPPHTDDAVADELGLPGLVDSAWVAIVEAQSPRLLIRGDAGSGALGSPVLSARGATIDASKPIVNYQVGFTRFGGRPLIQVYYFFWFGTSSGGADAAAGVDGFIWRVTLDDSFQPIIYDTIRASGLDHLWFPVQPLRQRSADAALLLPQPGQAPKRPVLLLDRDNTLLRVLADAPAVEARPYTLQRYEELYRLQTVDGRSRNLFTPDGLVAGVNPPGAVGPFGRITDLGAPRHLSHLPAGPLEAKDFDDPTALADFEAPTEAAQATGQP